jgi:Mg-chelatase subunit ChlD
MAGRALLFFAARFRAAMAIYSVENPKNRFVLIHITDGRCGEPVVSGV